MKLTLTAFYSLNKEIRLGCSQNLFAWTIKVGLIKLQSVVAFLTISHLQAVSCIELGLFLHGIPVDITVSW